MAFIQMMGSRTDVELTGADIAGSLQKMIRSGICVFDVVETGELSVCFSIRHGDFRKLRAIAESNGDRLKIIRQRGLMQSLNQLWKRPVLIIGILLIFCASWILPGRILIVEVEGNSQISKEQILEAASNSGIKLWAPAREVRSEKMKNALLSKLPQLQWAGVNTYGSRAVITVRERSLEQLSGNHSDVSSIVAERDGVILSCTVTRGNALCRPGQAVRAGDVLISGYTDCGLTIEATRAEGEIYALTKHSLSVISPSTHEKRGDEMKKTFRYAVCIGKKRINFYKGSGISDGTCVKMYSEYVLTLPGGYHLPVTLIRETVTQFHTEIADVDQAIISEGLSDYGIRYLSQHMIAGSVLGRSESFSELEDAVCMTGLYECQEMIGRRKPERIGEYHGKTD